MKFQLFTRYKICTHSPQTQLNSTQSIWVGLGFTHEIDQEFFNQIRLGEVEKNPLT